MKRKYEELKARLILAAHGVDWSEDEGSQTAEYAMVALAAAAFAGILIALFKGGEVKELLLGIITRALGA